MDTGKQELLICNFPNDCPNRPECFEVKYSSVGNLLTKENCPIGFEIYETRDKVFQKVEKFDDAEFCKSWIRIFGNKGFSSEEPKVNRGFVEDSDTSDSTIEAEQDTDIDFTTGIEQQHDNQSNLVNESEIAYIQSAHMENIPKILAEPEISANLETKPPFITDYMPEPPKPHPSFTASPNNNCADLNASMIYISMMQQQINALQAQIFHQNMFQAPKSLCCNSEIPKSMSSVGIQTDTDVYPLQSRTTGTNTEGDMYSIVHEKISVETNTSMVVLFC
jgi:hypothetical protein